MKFCFWLVYAVAGVVYGCVYTEDKGLSVQRSGWEHEHRGAWPLELNRGRLLCDGPSVYPAVWFKSENGDYYPLNGVAITEAKKRGSPYQLSLDPIWLPNSEDACFRVSIGGLADLARSLCASN